LNTTALEEIPRVSREKAEIELEARDAPAGTYGKLREEKRRSLHSLSIRGG